MITTPTDRSTAGERALRVAVALPPVAVGVFTVVALALALGGRHPMWPISDANLTEAAATRDAATVIFLIQEGHDPNKPYRVRSGVLGRSPRRLTPLEAAVDEERLEIVDILMRHGVVLSDRQRVDLVCAARGRGDEEIVRYFETHWGTVTCDARQASQ